MKKYKNLIDNPKINKSYWVVLFPFLETIQYNLFGIPFVFLYFYLTKNIELTLSVIFLVFWGNHIFIHGLTRGIKRFPNSKNKKYLLLGDLILTTVLFLSISYFYLYLFNNGFTILNIIFIIYLLLIPILNLIFKIFK